MPLKRIGIVVLVLCADWAIGQDVATISDKDGYTNIRDTTSLNSRIIGKIYEGDIFYYTIDTNKEWAKVYYSTSIGRLGFIHKSRLMPLLNLRTVDLNSESQNGQFKVKNDSLFFQIDTYRFDSTKHKIEKGKGGQIMKIDNCYPLGVFHRIPDLGTERVKLVIHGKEIIIPKKDFQDLYQLNLASMKLSTDNKGGLYIYSSNSDGAGGYELIWIIKKGKYYKREILIP